MAEWTVLLEASMSMYEFWLVFPELHVHRSEANARLALIRVWIFSSQSSLVDTSD